MSFLYIRFQQRQWNISQTTLWPVLESIVAVLEIVRRNSFRRRLESCSLRKNFTIEIKQCYWWGVYVLQSTRTSNQ